MDDLVGARDLREIRAIGVSLCTEAFGHHRRSPGLWCGREKHVLRLASREEGAFGERFEAAFDELFEQGEVAPAIRLVEDIYAPAGGLLRVWRSDAPPHRHGEEERSVSIPAARRP